MKIILKAKYVAQHPLFYPGSEETSALFRAFGREDLTPEALPHLHHTNTEIEIVGDTHMVDEKPYDGIRTRTSVTLPKKSGKPKAEASS
jgi:hypothetical protein